MYVGFEQISGRDSLIKTEVDYRGAVVRHEMVRTVSSPVFWSSLVTVFIASSLTRADNPDDLLIITYSTTKIDKISIEELKAIFLKHRELTIGGFRVLPIHAPDDSVARKRFVEQVLGMTIEDERAFWQKQKIKKGLTPPPTFTNICKAVFKLKSAIGYVRRSDYKGVNKVLLVIPAK